MSGFGDNSLHIFKDHDPRMADYAGSGKVVYNSVCNGNNYSYSAEQIGAMFEGDGRVPDHVLPRLVIMMHYLQEGYHSGHYNGTAGEYEYARQEYPERYLSLVRGLTDAALEEIRNTRMSSFTSQVQDNLGKVFVEQLLQDRSRLHSANISRGNGEIERF